MVSPRKHEANRLNAQKSTGPRTADGKKKSSANAISHGLYCHALVLDSEDMDFFLKFRDSFVCRLNPQDPVELSCVDQIVEARWKLRRIQDSELKLHRFRQLRLESILDRRRLGELSVEDEAAWANIDERIDSLDDKQFAQYLATLGLGDCTTVSLMGDDECELERYERFRSRFELSISRASRELRELQRIDKNLRPQQPSPYRLDHVDPETLKRRFYEEWGVKPRQDKKCKNEPTAEPPTEDAPIEEAPPTDQTPVSEQSEDPDPLQHPVQDPLQDPLQDPMPENARNEEIFENEPTDEVKLKVVRHQRFAFSLIELIVVIGIIAILIGLLMPTLSVVRDHAKQLKCATQLRQLGTGLANYAANFKGAYPTCSNWHVYGGDGTGEDEAGPAWTEQLEPYFARVNSGIYLCPAFEPETQYNYFLGIHYIMVVEQRMDLKTSDIGLSSNYILSGDCTHARLYPPPWGQAQLFLYTNDCDKDDARWKCLSFFGEEYGRNAHRAGNNVLFGDYHVRPYRKFEPSEMTYNPKKGQVDFDQVADEQ